MRRLALIGLLALACDDPDVSDKALALLEFGVVQAKATCPGVQVHLNDDCPKTGGEMVVWHKLADGSSFVSWGAFQFLLGRSEDQEFLAPNYPLDTVSLAPGELTVHKDTCTDEVIDISSECTGFNLEAFE